jgi:hypothetical protein
MTDEQLRAAGFAGPYVFDQLKPTSPIYESWVDTQWRSYIEDPNPKPGRPAVRYYQLWFSRADAEAAAGG